jgi:diketogulonate reductase-like aldo/keto reductase
MEDFVRWGKIRNIGVSNFNINQLKNILKQCKIKPATNIIEVHPYFQNDKLVDFCQQNDIMVIAYAPL